MDHIRAVQALVRNARRRSGKTAYEYYQAMFDLQMDLVVQARSIWVDPVSWLEAFNSRSRGITEFLGENNREARIPYQPRHGTNDMNRAFNGIHLDDQYANRIATLTNESAEQVLEQTSTPSFTQASQLPSEEIRRRAIPNAVGPDRHSRRMAPAGISLAVVIAQMLPVFLHPTERFFLYGDLARYRYYGDVFGTLYIRGRTVPHSAEARPQTPSIESQGHSAHIADFSAAGTLQSEQTQFYVGQAAHETTRNDEHGSCDDSDSFDTNGAPRRNVPRHHGAYLTRAGTDNLGTSMEFLSPFERAYYHAEESSILLEGVHRGWVFEYDQRPSMSKDTLGFVMSVFHQMIPDMLAEFRRNFMKQSAR